MSKQNRCLVDNQPYLRYVINGKLRLHLPRSYITNCSYELPCHRVLGILSQETQNIFTAKSFTNTSQRKEATSENGLVHCVINADLIQTKQPQGPNAQLALFVS